MLSRTPGVEGSASVEVVLDGEGRLASSAARSFKLNDPVFLECMKALLPGATFPKPTANAAAVSYPILFVPE
jgi:hypothetical protein